MNTNKKIAVIGDAFADLTTNIIGYPPEGEATQGTPFLRNGGGTSGNIAAGLGVLGADVSLICRLGDDENGEFIKKGIEDANVDTMGIYMDPENASGVVLIAVGPSGERTIWMLAEGSAYEKLSVENLRYLDKVNPHGIFITGVMMGVQPAEDAILEILPKWKGKARIYFDPNLRYPSDGVPEKVKRGMQKLCALSDVVLTGSSEMQALGLSPLKGQIFIVKEGKQGSYLSDENGTKQFTIYPTEHVAIDATGAGDTYAAAYIFAETEGMDVKSAMEYATVAAGLAVTVKGARSTPTRKAIEEYINKKG